MDEKTTSKLFKVTKDCADGYHVVPVRSVFLATVFIRTDEDFRFEDYHNLNYKTFVVADPLEARNEMREHLKHVLDTWKWLSKHKGLKEDFEKVFNNTDLWVLDSKNTMRIDRDFGNWALEYSITQVPVKYFIQ